jgi:hypothetical protein
MFDECQHWDEMSDINLFFLLTVLRFEFGTSCILGRCSIACAMPPDLSYVVILETGFHFLPRLACIMSLLFYSSHKNDKCMPPCPALGWGYHELFAQAGLKL